MLPPPWLIQTGAALALLLGAWAHGYQHGKSVEQRQTAEAVQAATDAARAEESRRVMRLQEAQDAEHLARKAAQRDAAAARAAADGLREQARLVARASSCPASDPAPPVGSAPASDGAGVLADVLGELAARADQLAVAADSARIAGQLCQSAYDALRPQQ